MEGSQPETRLLMRITTTSTSMISRSSGLPGCPVKCEGRLLDHSYAPDICVVEVPDEFSGEVLEL
jgi:hypothetical protein